jgi:hypothetical protein
MSSVFDPEIWKGWAPVDDTLQRMTKDGILVTVSQHSTLQGWIASWENVRKGTGHNITARHQTTLHSAIERHYDLSQGWVA